MPNLPKLTLQTLQSSWKVGLSVLQNCLTYYSISYFHLFLLLLWYLRLAIKRAWVAWGSTIACIRLAPCDKIRDVKFLVLQGPLAHALYSLAKSHLSELRSFARHLPPVASTKSSARSLHKNIQTWRKCWRVLFSKARKCLRRTQFDSFECILEFV